jgi:hypothetical protein
MAGMSASVEMKGTPVNGVRELEWIGSAII